MRRNDRAAPDVQVRGPAQALTQTIDTYYRPGRDTRSADALQRGLGALSAVFQEEANALREQRRKNEYTQGQMDALREEAGMELEGVKRGTILRQHSRFYMEGLNEGRGSAASLDWAANLENSFQESGVGYDDEEKFRGWMDQQVASFLSGFGDNPAALRAAMPMVTDSANRYAAGFAKRRDAYYAAQRKAVFNREVEGAFQMMLSGGLDGVESLKALREEYFLSDGPIANDAFIEAALRYAEVSNDPDALAVVMENAGPGGFNLDSSEYEKVIKAQRSLADRLEKETSRQETQRNRLNKKIVEEAEISFHEKLLSDPTLDPVQEYRAWLAEGNAPNPDVQAAFNTAYNSFEKARANTEPPEGVLMGNFLVRLGAAKDRGEAMGIINEAASWLTGSQFEKYFDRYRPEGSLQQYFSNTFAKSRFDNVSDRLKAFEASGNVFSTDTGSTLQIYGTEAYQDYIQANYMPGDDIKKIDAEAREYVGSMLLSEFGGDQTFVQAMSDPRNAILTRDLGIDNAVQDLMKRYYANMVETEGVSGDAARARPVPKLINDIVDTQTEQEPDKPSRTDGRKGSAGITAVEALELLGVEPQATGSADDRRRRQPKADAVDTQADIKAIDQKIAEIEIRDAQLRRGLGVGRSVTTERALDALAAERAQLEQQRMELLNSIGG